MGAANERSKSLETAAFAVAAEVVENPVWAETWRAAAVGAKPTFEVWSADYKAVAGLLESIQGLESCVTMADFFELGRFFFSFILDLFAQFH
jgi:mediator of RNA polymerase II transcription subunit 13